MIGLRKALAVGALLALAGLLWTLDRGPYGVNPRLVPAARLLLIPLAAAVTGVVLEKIWGRWLGLAAAIVVLPWALALTFGLPAGVPLIQQTIALIASGMLLLTLSGRAMFQRYEGSTSTDWSGPRMALVRWTLILNIASAAALFIFVAVNSYTIEWHVVFPAVLILGLAVGVALLGRQVTGGLLLVGLVCVLFVPAGVLFVLKESSYAGGVRIFAMNFIPGLIAGWACLFAFGKPVWLALRSD